MKTTIAVEELCCALETLLKQDLNGTEWSVAATHLLHQLRTGRTRWRWSNELLAKKLGVHRNAVGRAYSRLESAGILSRETPARRSQAAVKEWLLPVCAVPCPTLGQHHSNEQPEGAAVSAPAPRQPEVVAVQVPEREPPASHEPIPSPIQNIVPPKRVRRFDLPSPQEQMNILHRLPEPAKAALAAATLEADPSKFQPDPAWQLDDRTVEFLLSTIPVPEPIAQAPAPTRPVPMAQPEGVLTRMVAHAVASARGRVRSLVSTEEAAQRLLAEIAYSVHRGQIGRGDPAGGVRAAVSLIRDGRWAAPRGMDESWYRRAMPALSAMH